MRIKVIGKAHLKGTSKRTGNPYDFIQIHYNGPAFGVEGVAACTLSLDPQQYNVPNNVDRLLKKRHPNDRLNKTPFCRQGGG
mgnify:CR=1 FL=1